MRDPVHPDRDTYSSLEAQAVAYAYAKGALLVAAVGNGDEAFSQPWPYASYPAALPHVIGVSALTRSGNVPDYSNRDLVFNDISAPGSGIFSTFPLSRSPRSGRSAPTRATPTAARTTTATRKERRSPPRRCRRRRRCSSPSRRR